MTATGNGLALRLDEVRREADGVLSLLLRDPQGRPLPAWAPGAHVNVLFGNGVERQYSLCSDPADDSGWRIAVLREDVSRGGSHYVHDLLRPGELVRASQPIDTFSFVEGTETVLVAGGIGITPLLPMTRALTGSERPWRLLYLGRSRERMAFVGDEVLDCANVRIVAADEEGRVELAGAIGSLAPGARVFGCGPVRLLDELEALSAEWPVGTLRVERFHARPLAEPVSTDAFEVEARRSGVSVIVDGERSILTCLEQAGIAVPCSCLEGVCGTCETVILDGVADHRDSILSAEERAENESMMICVSRAVTPRLVLDL